MKINKIDFCRIHHAKTSFRFNEVNTVLDSVASFAVRVVLI